VIFYCLRVSFSELVRTRKKPELVHLRCGLAGERVHSCRAEAGPVSGGHNSRSDISTE
jgi:hypothetical protein